MPWPSPSDFVDIPRKRYAATRKAKDSAFKIEIEAIREKSSKDRAPKVKKTKVSPELEEFIRSPGFRSWYEEVTCKSADGFVSFLLDCEEWLLLGESRDHFAAKAVKKLFEDYRWQTPSYRRYWAKRIYDCKEPRKRRAIILHLATPRWANLMKVAQFHKRRAEIALETGIPHDVDHVIPLQGHLVCGLNNEFNLRIIPSSVNRSKSNKYAIEDEPEADEHFGRAIECFSG